MMRAQVVALPAEGLPTRRLLRAGSVDLHEYRFEFSGDLLRCTIVVHGQSHLRVKQRLGSINLQRVQEQQQLNVLE